MPYIHIMEVFKGITKWNTWVDFVRNILDNYGLSMNHFKDNIDFGQTMNMNGDNWRNFRNQIEVQIGDKDFGKNSLIDLEDNTFI